MRSHRLAALGVVCALALACTGGPESGKSQATPDPSSFLAAPSAPRATAGLLDRAGKTVGLIEFREDRVGVQIEMKVLGLPPGMHGVHIHAVGRCEAPAFTTAAGHFNPANKTHGFSSAGGPHAGDLGNIEVKPDGTGEATLRTPHLSLAPGASNSPLVGGGLSIVVHANADDDKTDPSGNSGDRIACGLVKATPRG